MSRSPKGRAATRGLDARLRLQQAFMPVGDASLKNSSGQSKCWLTVITVSTVTIWPIEIPHPSFGRNRGTKCGIVQGGPGRLWR